VNEGRKEEGVMARKKAEVTEPTAEPTAKTTSDFVALSKVKHDGKLYGKGKTLQLTEAQAARLLAHKAVEPAK
jgi:hypothetical protein